MLENGTLLKQGAEARIFELPFLGKSAIAKQRFHKTYRHPVLDKKLTSRRVIQEARCLLKCRKFGIDTPVVYFVDVENSTIFMEKIEGMTVKEALIAIGSDDSEQVLQYARLIGKALAMMHGCDVIHGDLTTSNLFLRESVDTLVIIDFGLSYISQLPEDKAVDLYVLERAFLSTHPKSEKMFEEILVEYRKASKGAQVILNKLEEVRLRGRKRSMLG
ncbi:serine/threonine-protein kinase bud32 [Basidiobolus ranarum]|uniref:non-specific serine/threonine protein kinase n=1 Tax=Basidiobolus ranarum TaxID=34480 RepID=A0ABR2X205_9FUNG